MLRKIEILETARKLFNESNTQSVTTNHIAKEMGISPGNLHYHYCNREEIIRILYTNMREEMTLSRDDLPKTLEALSQHQKVLIGIQCEYRFFFREMLFLLSRDDVLKQQYIKDNVAHRARIRFSIVGFVENGELNITDDTTLEYVTDAILMSWQFYTSHIQTLGMPLSRTSAQEAVQFTTNAMKPYKVNTL